MQGETDAADNFFAKPNGPGIGGYHGLILTVEIS
jgi:hypothetical protein